MRVVFLGEKDMVIQNHHLWYRLKKYIVSRRISFSGRKVKYADCDIKSMPTRRTLLKRIGVRTTEIIPTKNDHYNFVFLLAFFSFSYFCRRIHLTFYSF